MRKLNLLVFILLLGATMTLAGCTGFNYGAALGGANTHPAPGYADARSFGLGGSVLHMNTTPGQVGLNAGEGRKLGESCSMSILNLIAFGDSSLETAKKNGNITKVASVEHKVLGIVYYIFHQHCTVVRGS